MGAQWKHAGKMDAANRKGKIVGKLVKEIMVATKMGGPDPTGNARLRAALEDARKNSVTKDSIDRAIKRGSGQTDENISYATLTYEGFAPHNVPVIVECLTENNNRTAGEIRVLFRKGQLGSSGAVAWMFDRLGIIEATIAKPGVDIEDTGSLASYELNGFYLVPAKAIWAGGELDFGQTATASYSAKTLELGGLIKYWIMDPGDGFAFNLFAGLAFGNGSDGFKSYSTMTVKTGPAHRLPIERKAEA